MHTNNLLTILALVAVSALIVVLLISYDLKSAISALLSLKPYYLLAAIAAFLAYNALKYLPWAYVIRETGDSINKLYSFLMMLSFFGLNVLPTGVTSLIPLEYLNKFHKNMNRFSTSIFISLSATGFLSLVLVAMVSSILVSQYISTTVAIAAISYFLISLLGYGSLFKRIAKKLRKAKNHTVHSIVSYLETMAKTRSFLSQKNILSEIALFIPALLCEDLIVYFTLISLNQSISFLYVLFAFSLADTLGLLSLVPSGIGVLDFSLAGLLSAGGVPGAVSLSTVLIYRFFYTGAGAVIGYSSLIAINRLKIKRNGRPKKH